MQRLFEPSGAWGLAVLGDSVIGDDAQSAAGGCVELVRARLSDGTEIGRTTISGASLRGLTTDAGRLVAVVGDREITTASPGDWEMTLRWYDGDVSIRTILLGPGNWTVVTEPRAGGLVVAWDLSEGQGIRGFDVTGERWRVGAQADRVLRAGAGRIVVLAGEGRVVSERDEATGELTWDVPLPSLPGVRWTAAAPLGRDLVVAGGRDRDGVIVGVVRRGSGAFERVGECPLTTFTSAEQIENALADECCGYDLNDVAWVRAIDEESIVLVVGGTGTSAAACQGRCIVALVRRGGATWDVVEVDGAESATDVLPIGDDVVLVDCWGTVYRCIVDARG